MASIIFDDTFEVSRVDNEKFENVARIKAKAQTFLADIEVDINTEIYPIQVKDTLRIAVARSANSQMEMWDGSNASIGHLADEYEYVMYGKVYKKAPSKKGGEGNTGEVVLYASFGGLLMSLEAEKADLEGAHLDDRVYLLVKRVY
jgi:DNA-directed RNA polymerase I, II, and III subunit RPABC3